MANFRPGTLNQGDPLGMTYNTVYLTADNTTVDPKGYSMLQIGSDNATATNRTFTLLVSPIVGHELLLYFYTGSSTTAELQNTGIQKLASAWTPTQYQILCLVSDGTNWVERSRGASTLNIALADTHLLVGNGSGVATDVAVSGDLTLADTGAFTIANLAVTNAKVSASAAIAFSKLATLTSGNILVGNGSNVAASVAVSGDVTIDNTGATTLGAAKVTLAKLDPAVMLEATGTLTQANLIAMNGTPVTLVAAPASGKVHIVDEIELFHSYSTAAYTLGGDVQIQYTGAVVITDIDKTIVTNTSSTNRLIRPTIYNLDDTTGTAIGFALTANVAKAIEITNDTAVFAAGNAANVLKYRVRYHTVTVIV